MTDRTELIQRLRMRAVDIHRQGDVARAQLIGRTIELLLHDEHPSFGRAVASELKLTAAALKDSSTRALICDALRELNA